MTELFAELLLPLQEQLHSLADKPEETPEVTLHALWIKTQGQMLSAKLAQAQARQVLTPAQIKQLQQWLSLRLSGVPLAHILERQAFMGLELISSPAALIPRIETEILAQLALTCIRQRCSAPNPLVIDICTGSGNIALALGHSCPQARIFGSDLAAAAVQLAHENAVHLKLQERVSFRCGDLLAPFHDADFLQKVDVLICNPPYILASNVDKMPTEISAHEPAMAFDGGPLGIAIIERTLREAVDFLKPGGWLCLEIGAGQGTFVEKRLRKSGHYTAIETACDHTGVVRAIACQKISPQTINQ